VPSEVTPTFFKTPADLRRWLTKNGGTATELWIGMYKKSSGRGGVTYREALDEALCFGWIDGVRKRLDDEAFVQRFTPRTVKSYWSEVNVKRAQQLIEAGRMHATGRAAFGRRDPTVTERYSFERRNPALEPAAEKQFRANAEAWRRFAAETPSYRRVAIHYVVSAKRPETRQRRLEILITETAAGRRIGLVSPKRTNQT
jgi:uncharacterized protein YdeI (YjbR/CyaY-like superfamily)